MWLKKHQQFICSGDSHWIPLMYGLNLLQTLTHLPVILLQLFSPSFTGRATRAEPPMILGALVMISWWRNCAWVDNSQV